MPRIHAVQTRGAAPLVRAWERVVEAGGDLDYAAAHRAEFMWPWETEPHSVAGGILDDETYDWVEVVRGVVETGGVALTVSEARLVEAWDLARSVAPTCATGASGLAGAMELASRGLLEGRVAVVLSGRDR